MDIDNTISAIKYVISNFSEVINDNNYSKAYSDNLKFHKSILKLNQCLLSFKKVASFPEVEYSLVPVEIPDKFFNNDKYLYFRPLDYQFSFLIFLFLNYEKHNKSDLRVVIDDFLDKVKSQFTINDIVRTETGAVRCKTNIRFAVNRLRELGLLNYYDKDVKRNWSPTLLGFIVCCYAVMEKPFKEDVSGIYGLSYLDKNKNYMLDSRLIKIIQDLNNPEKFWHLINRLELGLYHKSSISQLEILLREYSSFLNRNLDDCLNHVISQKDFDIRFKDMLFKVNSRNNVEDFKNELIVITKIRMNMDKVNKILLLKYN